MSKKTKVKPKGSWRSRDHQHCYQAWGGDVDAYGLPIPGIKYVHAVCVNRDGRLCETPAAQFTPDQWRTILPVDIGNLTRTQEWLEKTTRKA